MEVISTVLLFGLAAVPVVVVSAWFAARGHRGLGPLVGGGGAAWWRTQMPWPQGVQESDDVHWHFTDPAATRPAPEESGMSDAGNGEPRVEVDHVDPHIRLR